MTAIEIGRRSNRRRMAILKLIAEGQTIKETAYKLKVTPKAIEWHLDKLKKSLGIKNMILLIHWALMHGIAEFKVGAKHKPELAHLHD